MKQRFKSKPSGFQAIDSLFERPAFESEDWDRSFSKAIGEAFDFHYAQNSVFRSHCEMAGFQKRKFDSIEDVESIPWIFIQNFKEAELYSVPKEEISLTLTSSGTGGKKSYLYLDDFSLNRIESAAFKVYEGMNIVSEKSKPCHNLMFTYDIDKASDLGTAWTDVLISEMVPSKGSVFLIQENRGKFDFDLNLALAVYDRWSQLDVPVRFLGFPAFMYRLFKEIKERKLKPLRHAQDSWVLTGGGWKNHTGEIIGKKAFTEFCHETTGIEPRNVRDLFGMSEHGVGYVECEEGKFHIPTYAHMVVRDVHTMKKKPLGESGLLHLYSPILKSYPSLSLLTTDEVLLHSEPCKCGRSRPTMEYIGRVGLKHHETCAIKALEAFGT